MAGEGKSKRVFVGTFPETAIYFHHVVVENQKRFQDTYDRLKNFDSENEQLDLKQKQAKFITLRGDTITLLHAASVNLQSLKSVVYHRYGFEDLIPMRDKTFTEIKPNFSLVTEIRTKRAELAEQI